MAVDKKVEEMLSPVGVPVAYRQFKPYKNKPVPSPPYLIYLFPSERGYGPDNCNLIIHKRVSVELYTNAKNTQLEKKVEAAISAYKYEKSEDYIDSENMYMVTYDFNIYEKIRR